MAKYLTNRALDTDRATALWDEAVGQELVTGTEDCREGLAAFAERRPAGLPGLVGGRRTPVRHGDWNGFWFRAPRC